MSIHLDPLEEIPAELIETVLPGAGRRKQDPFIKGPVPLWWLQTAAKECGTSALAVGLSLFFKQGVGAPLKPVTKTEAEKWGLSRNTKDTVLKKLQGSKLVKMVPYNGHRCVPVLDLETRRPKPETL